MAGSGATAAAAAAATPVMMLRRVMFVMSPSLAPPFCTPPARGGRPIVAHFPSDRRQERRPRRRPSRILRPTRTSSNRRVPRNRNFPIAGAALFHIGEAGERIVEALHQHLFGDQH